jgi:hypothetical protein
MGSRVTVEAITERTSRVPLEMLEMGAHSVLSGPMRTNPAMALPAPLHTAGI